MFVSSAMALAPGRSRRKLQAKEFERIRRTACGVHDALELGPWACKCLLSHKANLRLEARVTSNESGANQIQYSLPLRFRFLFSFDADHQTQTCLPPWNWHETDIVPLDDEINKTGNKDLVTTASDLQKGPRPPSGTVDATLSLACV